MGNNHLFQCRLLKAIWLLTWTTQEWFWLWPHLWALKNKDLQHINTMCGLPKGAQKMQVYLITKQKIHEVTWIQQQATKHGKSKINSLLILVWRKGLKKFLQPIYVSISCITRTNSNYRLFLKLQTSGCILTLSNLTSFIGFTNTNHLSILIATKVGELIFTWLQRVKTMLNAICQTMESIMKIRQRSEALDSNLCV